MRTHILYSRNLNFLCETVPPNLMRFQPFYRKSNASLIFPSHMVYVVRRWEEEEEERTRRTSPHYRSEGRRQGSCGVFLGLCNTICALCVCVSKKNTIFAITSINLQYKNRQTPTELDSDQDPPKAQHDPCRRPGER